MSAWKTAVISFNITAQLTDLSTLLVIYWQNTDKITLNQMLSATQSNSVTHAQVLLNLRKHKGHIILCMYSRISYTMLTWWLFPGYIAQSHTTHTSNYISHSSRNNAHDSHSLTSVVTSQHNFIWLLKLTHKNNTIYTRDAVVLDVRQTLMFWKGKCVKPLCEETKGVNTSLQ